VRFGEETPLLRDVDRGIKRDDESLEALTDESRGDEDDVVDANKANQQVRRGRGILIILSLWGLIFLQGMIMLPGL